MIPADATSQMTAEQLMAVPDDGRVWELIRGRPRDRGTPLRGFRHATSLARIGTALSCWSDALPGCRRGVVLGYRACFRLAVSPDTVVEADVSYLSPGTAAGVEPNAVLIDVPPVLVVEILSPSDTQDGIAEKVRAYLDAGVPLVWLAEPVFRTVTVHRPDAPPVMYNATRTITGEEHLPGFTAVVAGFFESPLRR